MNKSRFQQRSRIDIIACILENSNDGARKTRLIYKCNLSFSQFNHYKDCLVDSGLLRVSNNEDGTEVFEVTERGREFLRDYKKIKSVLDKMRI
ncbi:MAG: winged helix-turn-helix domain-containing protein [Candidatus Bathyarchaeia archaeon]